MIKFNCVKCLPGKRVFSLRPLERVNVLLIWKNRNEYSFRFILNNSCC